MRAGRWALAAALALAAAPASAFLRTEAVKDGSLVAGRCLWWAGNEVRYTVNVDAANTAGCGDAATELQLVKDSLATWGGARTTPQAPVCTGFHFTFAGESPTKAIGFEAGGTRENLIVIRRGRCLDQPGWSTDPCRSVPGACADKWNCWEYDAARNDRDWDGGHRPGTIALTTTSFDANTGEIVDADMELFDGDPRLGSGFGFWFTCRNETTPVCDTSRVAPDSALSTACTSIDLGGTVTHEAGHMLGLAHTPDQSATMYASAGPGEITKRVLKLDDVKGVCTIYPAGQPPQTGGGFGESGAACAALPPPEPKKSTGCSTAGGDAAGLLLAVGALARLRLGRLAARLRRR